MVGCDAGQAARDVIQRSLVAHGRRGPVTPALRLIDAALILVAGPRLGQANLIDGGGRGLSGLALQGRALTQG